MNLPAVGAFDRESGDTVNGADSMLRLLIFIVFIMAAVWGLKVYRNAVGGMTKFQKTSNIIVSVGLLVLLGILIFPLIR